MFRERKIKILIGVGGIIPLFQPEETVGVIEVGERRILVIGVGEHDLFKKLLRRIIFAFVEERGAPFPQKRRAAGRTRRQLQELRLLRRRNRYFLLMEGAEQVIRRFGDAGVVGILLRK